MSIKNFSPRTRYENERPIVRAQPSSTDDKNPFSNGAFQDLDGYLVPPKGVHLLENYRCFPNRLLARGGVKTWSDTLLPPLPGRTGYSLTKLGTTVTKTVGTDFSVSDVGNYIVYDDGKHERISAYISTTEVTVEQSAVHAASTAAYLRGPKNALMFHEKNQVYILFIDTRLFYSASITIPSWTQIYMNGIGNSPSSTISKLREYDDYATLQNSAGWFKINLDDYVYWRMNSAIPSTRITDIEETDTKPYCRNVTYSMVRLSGNGQNSNRYDSGVTIEHESGTVASDESNKDYGEIFTERPIGAADTYYGILTGDALVAPNNAIAAWASYSVVQFGIEVNDVVENITADMTGVLTMDQVAERLQIGINIYFPKVTVAFEAFASGGRFIITSEAEGSTIDYVTAGAGALDIGTAIMKCESGSGTITTPTFTESVVVSLLEVPIDPDTDEYDSHWNRYSLHATLNVKNEANNNQRYMWVEDIPVAKAFVASLTGNVVTATVGAFVPGDVGCWLRFQSGTEMLIVGYTDSSTVVINGASTISSQPAAIGGNDSLGKEIRVATASQSGNTVTATSGDSFLSTDVGRKIYWANGYESTIKEYTSSTEVEVVEDYTISSTGCCFHPKCRAWTDTIRDTPYLTSPNLSSRIAEYTLQNRLFTPIENCDIGDVTANMIWGAKSGEKIIYYCAADTNYRHQAGYHYASVQREFFQDAIIEISEMEDYLSVKCHHSTRAIPLNQFGSHTIPGAGTAIIKCSGNIMINPDIGVRYQGNVCYIDKSSQIVITSEPAIRRFDGREYGENLADKRIQKILETMQVAFACCYEAVNGFTFWGNDE